MTGMTGGVFLPWLTFLRDLSLKSALLLLVAWALALAMRRASAAARHLVWLLTFAALLFLPLLSLTLPPRPVAVLPAPAAPLVSLRGPNKTSLRGALAPNSEDRPLAPNSGGTREAIREAVSGSPPVNGGRGQGAISSPAWPALFCLLWLGGVLLAALPLGLGWVGAVRRIRRCTPVTDSVLLALAAEAGRRLGVRRPVALRSGPRVAVPVTFGGLRPVVLLPDGAAAWPSERLRVALLHEMAHVRRGDWATQTTARLVCALFWHNPLVWLGARRLRAEAERACDDRVLALGIPAPDYAQHLLAVAGALAGADRPLPLAVPMAGQTALESRLRAVLAARPRRAPSRRLAACAFVLALVVLVPLAALRPAARAARRMTSPSPSMAAVLPAPPRAVRPAPASPSVSISSPPKGVPSMKPLMPVKTVALAALAAGLALPVAQAKPVAPARHPSAPMLAGTQQIEAVLKDLNARTKASPPLIDFATQGEVVNSVGMLFQGSHRNYVIEPGVSGSVKLDLYAVPFDKALSTLVGANSEPLEWSVQDGVYHIRPRAAVADGKAASAAPRQVQLKFEWVSAAGASGAAPDKNIDTLTVVAEEGRKTQVGSRHLRNGMGGGETITVLARVKPGGVVTLDITEHSDTTARAGETLSNGSQTTVSVKDGETGAVGGLVLGSQPSGQSAQRLLFVTPTIIRSSD